MEENTFLHILADKVTMGIFIYIGGKGCNFEDLLNTDVMKEEFKVLVETMEECGLIERIGDTVQLTEKGFKISGLCEELKELFEVPLKEREVST